MTSRFDVAMGHIARIAGVDISPERVHACLVLALLRHAKTDEERLDILERQMQVARAEQLPE